MLFRQKAKCFVLLQFHVEGFVNQYVAPVPRGDEAIVLTSQIIENIPSEWACTGNLQDTSADELRSLS